MADELASRERELLARAPIYAQELMRVFNEGRLASDELREQITRDMEQTDEVIENVERMVKYLCELTKDQTITGNQRQHMEQEMIRMRWMGEELKQRRWSIRMERLAISVYFDKEYPLFDRGKEPEWYK